MLSLFLFILIVGSALGLFMGLLVSMLFTLVVVVLSDSPRWKQLVFKGIIFQLLRSALAATLTYKLAFHGVFGLLSHSGPVVASGVAHCLARWAAFVAFLVGVNMLRLIPLLVHRKTAD